MLLIAAIAATLSLVIAACGAGASQAPALTDPEEILTQSLLSLKDVKTVEVVGTLTGELEVAELGGSLDLSSTTIAGAADVPNQKAKITIDAPSLMGTKLEAIVVDGFSYVKIDGLLAGMAGLESGTYTKSAIPEASGEPVTNDAEIDKQIEEFQKALDELPNPPTKEADVKCGDLDCYHIKIEASSEDMAEVAPEAEQVSGDVTIDLLVRKSDLRPAQLKVSVTTEEMGTVGITLDFKYDGTVDVSAPPADQVVEE
jgi:hypothetical protein